MRDKNNNKDRIEIDNVFKKMKILLINNLYKPFARGGAEKVVEVTTGEFIKEGHKVDIITTRPYFTTPKKQEEVIKVFYLRSLYFNLHKISWCLRFFWHIIDSFSLAAPFYVFWKIKKENYDLVITHNLKGLSYLIPLVVKLSGVKYYHTLHDIQLLHPSGLMIYKKERLVNSLFARIYIKINTILFGSPNKVVSPSHWLIDLHLKNGFFPLSKKEVVNNPISIHSAQPPLEVRRSERGEPFYFLYVGQIEHHKGVMLLIDAFKSISKNNRHYILTIVGDGSRLEEIKQRVVGWENIKVLGRKNKDEVRELMVNSDCLVVPSLCYENSPTVIYEALAARLYPLASDLGGTRELLNNNPEYLFKPEVRELRNKMVWAVENRGVLRNKIQDLSDKTFNFDAQKYLEKIL